MRYLMNLPRLILTLTFASIIVTGCSKNSEEETIITTPVDTTGTFFIKAVDASFIPEVRLSGAVTFNAAGDPEDMLTTLKNSGVNTIRLRLWYSTTNGHSGFEEVKAFSDEIKSKGMKVWLCVHYSDTWADPEKQVKPVAWKQLSYNTLLDSVDAYTRRITRAIMPDFIQIGNEINNGLLWPEGSSQNPEQMTGLIQSGISAVRAVSSKTKIMIHFAGIDDAEWLLNEYNIQGYDMVALSYYPIWHGKSLLNLEKVIYDIGRKFNKKVVIAETAYPFTLLWNDNTNNIIGSNNQILADFSATPSGQKEYMDYIAAMTLRLECSVGYCYWGGDWIAFKGTSATNGSSWENQALWDFDGKALPVLDSFKN